MALKFILQQPSPVWLDFSITDVKLFKNIRVSYYIIIYAFSISFVQAQSVGEEAAEYTNCISAEGVSVLWL